jgi:hypothetical protein
MTLQKARGWRTILRSDAERSGDWRISTSYGLIFEFENVQEILGFQQNLDLIEK